MALRVRQVFTTALRVRQVFTTAPAGPVRPAPLVYSYTQLWLEAVTAWNNEDDLGIEFAPPAYRSTLT